MNNQETTNENDDSDGIRTHPRRGTCDSRTATTGRTRRGRPRRKETTPAPAPGTAGIFKSNEELQAALKNRWRPMATISGPVQSRTPIRTASTSSTAKNPRARSRTPATPNCTTSSKARASSSPAADCAPIGRCEPRDDQGRRTHNVKKGDVIRRCRRRTARCPDSIPT